jgi:valyl-tRNA synthetase
MENIRPWVLSRQLWWGHRLPVWYRGGETYVGLIEPEGEGWERDPDVLDTWFSSALWPFATLGWPDRTPELRAFYPTDVLVTSRDIIFLWVARMIMMGLEFAGEVPFDDVHIHAIIQAPDGRRMSKSLGTGIDPLDLIVGGPRPPVFAELDDAGAARSGEAGRRAGGKPAGDFPAYGADALRWGLLAMSSAQDVRFSEDKVAQGLQLTNKLWNASRLILLGVGPDARAAIRPTTVEDRWILSRLERARDQVTRRIDSYDFSHAALTLYDLVYGELCDWYLELVKPRLRRGEADLEATLLAVLTETLALAHPMIPFVTEEIYSYVPGAEGLLAARTERVTAPGDEAAEATLQRVIEAVQALRGWRDLAGVKPGTLVPARLVAHGYEDTGEHLARLARLSLSEPDESRAAHSSEAGRRAPGRRDGADPVASVPVPGGAVEILASEDLDLEGAQRKLAAKRAKVESEIERSERKLANAGFVAKAPPQVVADERQKLQRLRAELEAL